jgi:hypothetical protein
MTFDEFSKAVEDAEITERRAREMVQRQARMCIGRLRNSKVPCYVLTELKRELRDWDMTRQQWRIR